MAKSLQAQVITQIDAVYKRPVLLYELYLSSTLRFAGYKSNVVFPTAGNTYYAKSITVDDISQDTEGQIDNVKVQFDNVSRDMAAYNNASDFKGKILIIKRVYLDAVGNALNYNEVFNGIMGNPSNINQNTMEVPASTGSNLDKKSLIVQYQRMCPWRFGKTECNTNGLADLTALKATGTADSGTTTTLIDNALVQASDYWNNGEISITKGTKTYYRKVADFDAATDQITFDVELPVAVDITCTYIVYKGCDQTWDTCGAANAWGPSGNNQINFGGCIHITTKADAG